MTEPSDPIYRLPMLRDFPPIRAGYTAAVACLLAALLASLLGCGGGSGGGGAGGGADEVPTMLAATFVGAASTPVAGDALLLQISKDVTLTTGGVLTDAELTLSGGGTLGQVTAAPTLDSARVVRITLGAGVSFTPGSTTIDFAAAGQSVIRDASGRNATAQTARTILDGDDDEPAISLLTLNAIPGELNGTGSAGGTLQVPQQGFTVDLTWSDASSAVDGATAVLSADRAVTVSGAARAAGTDLLGTLTEVSVTGSGASFLVPSSVVFPTATVTLTAYVRDASGRTSQPATFAFRAVGATDAIRPFDTGVNPSQVWFIDMSRDVESYTASTSGVAVTSGASSAADILELFLVLGLHSSTPIANVDGSKDSNQVVTDRFRSRMLAELATLFTGANVTFTFTSPGSFPSGSTSVPYGEAAFSQIAVAGAEDEGGTSGVLGVAIFDKNNKHQNDNTVTDFLGAQRLGVFAHTLIDSGIGSSAFSTFRTTFDALTPVHGGTAIGDDASDGQRLMGTLTDTRATTIDTAIRRLARSLAVVTAHECGHSMGLVQDGAMPTGLYGGFFVAFPGSTSGHIDNSATFPSGSQNVMSPAISFASSLSPSTAFNALNLAYLRERALYDE